MKFWLFLLAFVAIYLAFRLPWITCDPGIPSVWEYGYNATDEGYYLSGGKEKFVWGNFVDLPRNEAFTYGFSAGTHWLSYLSHLLFGLSTWTWRIPFLGIYFLAWLSMFCLVSKRAGPAMAFALCASASLVPMVVAYERTASNDALISALLVLSYVCAAGMSRWRIVCAGLLSGAIILVKPSVWVLLPVVAAGVSYDRELRSSLKDMALFAVIAIASAFAWKLLVALSVMPEATQAGVSIWEVVKRTTTHYPLPPIFGFASHFKGISAFPRDPSAQFLGVTAPLIFSVPLAVAAKSALAKRWNGNFLLFLAIPAYVAAVSVMNTIYSHYFLPAIAMLPIVISAIASELEQSASDEAGMTWKKAALPLLSVAALCTISAILIASYSVAPSTSQNFYSRIYNLPSKNVWGLTWPMILPFTATVVVAITFLQGFKTSPMKLAAWTLAALVAASVAFASFPAVQLAPYMKKQSGEFFAPMIVSMTVSTLFLVSSFGFRERLPWRKALSVAVPLCILSCFLATPNWRASFQDLVRRGTHQHQAAAKELEKLLPKDAIVIGERSNQMLMSLPIRTATTFAANSDPIPVIESILKSEPNAKLYALADSQHAYNLQHYREHADKYRLRPIKTFKMPSFGTGAPSDVHLAAIEVAGTQPK
ncbi:MAG: glycosyltransferase family 39 protein [Kiritimatiellae bacterium]|nr:glycosyltransferase family 39 protein [Kiritimatiellia bacterium]